MPLDEAISYTPHSFKHLFITAGRQLQIPEPAIDVMAGWQVKAASGMASIYDSVSASAELIYKDFVHKNFQNGWSLMEEGSVPLAPVVPFVANPQVMLEEKDGDWSLADRPKSTQKGADLQSRRLADSPLDGSVVQVLNTQVGVVHLFVGTKFAWKDPRSICGRWQCGSPDRPGKNSKFAAGSAEWKADNCMFGFCEACYGDCYPAERCSPSPVKPKSKKKPQSRASSSSSSSSSS